MTSGHPAGILDVLHEDPELLVLRKPAGLVCHPSKHGPLSSLIGRVRLYLGEAAQPQLVNRLDRETSGLVVVARTPAAARALRRVWESRAVAKEYWAIVHGHVDAEGGEIDAPLGRDSASAVGIKDAVRPEGAPAQTRFAVERRFQRAEGLFTWLRAWPVTGRKHQIRLHLAHLGHPIVGDKIYGGDERLYLDFVEGRLDGAQRGRLLLAHQALHARRIQFPWHGGELFFEAEPEPAFLRFLAGLPVPWEECDPVDGRSRPAASSSAD